MMDFGLAPFITPVYNVCKDIISWFKTRKERRDPLALLEVRRKWKIEFEKHLQRLDHAPTYGDAIIRDISRMDVYPEIDEKGKGISPWFKVEVKGLYHRGVELFLRIESAKYEESIQSWRWVDYDEPGAINVSIVGRIPFELVKAVEWDGDQYYYSPHIYCEFTKAHKQPYEEVVLYRREQGVSRNSDFFIEIAKYDDVKPNPKDVGWLFGLLSGCTIS